MYVSELLSKENWSKRSDSDERVYKADSFFANPWFLFHFLIELYSDLSFLAILLLE
jgi:hypothetical protein